MNEPAPAAASAGHDEEAAPGPQGDAEGLGSRVGTPESRLRFTMRALRALRACTGQLVEASTEDDLLTRVCAAVLEAGEFGLVWIGLAEDDPARTVRPVAMAGAREYLAGVQISWGDDELGRGPTGTAIRSGLPSVVNHVASEACFAPWRTPALQHGFRSSIAVPFSFEGVRAALNLYDVEPAAFGPEETAVLMELAQVLAYGLAARRTAERLRATTEAHRLSEARLLEAQRIAHVGCWEWDPVTDALFWTDEVFRIFGLDPAGSPSTLARFTGAIAPEDRPLLRAAAVAARCAWSARRRT